MSARKPSAAADSTRERILNAAEDLFGTRNFDSVSLRDITRQAGVTLALASYHFGTKDRLFAEVVARRARVLADLRQARLAALRDPDTAAILDAFMRPLFDKLDSGEPGWPAYLLVLSQLAQTNRWTDLLRDHFDPTARLFLAALARTLPDVPAPMLMRGFATALAAMFQTVARNRRIDALSGGAVTADDTEQAYRALLRFCTAGLNGLREA